MEEADPKLDEFGANIGHPAFTDALEEADLELDITRSEGKDDGSVLNHRLWQPFFGKENAFVKSRLDPNVYLIEVKEVVSPTKSSIKEPTKFDYDAMLISNATRPYFASILRFDHGAIQPHLAWIDPPNILKDISIHSMRDIKYDVFADSDIASNNDFKEIHSPYFNDSHLFFHSPGHAFVNGKRISHALENFETAKGFMQDDVVNSNKNWGFAAVYLCNHGEHFTLTLVIVITNLNKESSNSLVARNEDNAINVLGPDTDSSDDNNIMAGNESNATDSLQSNVYGGFTLSSSCGAPVNYSNSFGLSQIHLDISADTKLKLSSPMHGTQLDISDDTRRKLRSLIHSNTLPQLNQNSLPDPNANGPLSGNSIKDNNGNPFGVNSKYTNEGPCDNNERDKEDERARIDNQSPLTNGNNIYIALTLLFFTLLLFEMLGSSRVQKSKRADLLRNFSDLQLMWISSLREMILATLIYSWPSTSHHSLQFALQVNGKGYFPMVCDVHNPAYHFVLMLLQLSYP